MNVCFRVVQAAPYGGRAVSNGISYHRSEFQSKPKIQIQNPQRSAVRPLDGPCLVGHMTSSACQHHACNIRPQDSRDILCQHRRLANAIQHAQWCRDRAATPLAAHSAPSTHDAPGCNTCVPVTTTCVAHVKRHVCPFGHATRQFGACPRAPRTKRNAGQPIPACLHTLGGISRRGGRRHTNSYLVTCPRVPNMRPVHPDTSDPNPTAPRLSETTGTPQPPCPMLSCVPKTAACTLHARRHAPTSGHAPWIIGHRPGNAPATQCLTLTTQAGAVELTRSCGVPLYPATIARRIAPRGCGALHAGFGQGGWHGGTCVRGGVAVGGPELAAAALVAQ